MKPAITQFEKAHIRTITDIHDELANMAGTVRMEILIRELVKRKIMRREAIGLAGSNLTLVGR
jgi:hypothetical protein